MTSELRTRKKDVRYIDSIVSVVQITIIIVFLLIITEITLGGSYDLIILIIVVIASNGLTAIVMMFLFNRLLGYYRSHPERAILSFPNFRVHDINTSTSNNTLSRTLHYNFS